MQGEQREDLSRAGAAVQRIEPTLEVAAFFVHVEGAAVSFERVFATAAIDTRLKRGRGTVRV